MSRSVTCMCLTLFAAAALRADNVDLSTLPPRDTVQLTIYNSEDITLVRETRQLTFKKGTNTLQFSWAGTLIDPSSVELSFKTQADKLELVDSTYPHDRPQTVYWNINSEMDGAAQVQIMYFTSGLTWNADYVVITDPAESNMNIESYIRVFNNSGEEYDDASVRLVVGTINLVEKIAQLAQMPISQVQRWAAEEEEGQKKEFNKAKKRAARRVMESLGAPADAPAPKQIIRQGLSEYFLYTIEGTETISNGWSKRIRNFGSEDVKFKTQYRFRPQQYGQQLVKMFLLRNDEKNGLGSTPLPDGQVQLFRDNGRDGLSFLGQQYIKYVPIGDMIELNLGRDPQVIHKHVRLGSKRDDFWYHRSGVRVYYSQEQGHDIKIKDTVAGWRDHHRWVERIRNYTGKAIDVELRRSFDGHVEFNSALEPSLHDYRTVQLSAAVQPGEVLDLQYQITRLQGILSKQNNITLRKQ